MRKAFSFSARPLAWLALAGVGGVTLSDRSGASPWTWGCVLLLLLVFAFRTHRSVSVIACTICTFATIHKFTIDSARRSPVRQFLEGRTAPLEITAEGDVLKPLRRDLPGAEPGQAYFVAHKITASYEGRIWSGHIPLRLLPGREVDLAPGSYSIQGRLLIPPAPDNPGQFDERQRDLRHGFVAELRAREVKLVKPARWNLAASLDALAERCRSIIKGAVAGNMDGDEAARTVVLATVLGGAEADARELEDPFRVTGTLHIFAVAGLHVGIVGWITWRLLKPLGLSRATLAFIVCLVLFAYAFITGLRPSTVRAAVMAVLLLSGEFWHRRADMLNSLGAAALVLMIADTNQVFSIGFQFSFSVVIAIGIISSPLVRMQRRWTEQDIFLPEPLLNPVQRTTRWLRRGLAASLAVSTASWIGSLPFSISHFHLVSPVGMIANAVLVPLAFFIIFTTILTLAASSLTLVSIPATLGASNWAFARVAMFSAQAFALVPGGHFYFGASKVQTRPPAEMTVLRLGRGSAQHLQTPAGHWLLDCGSERDYEFITRAFLRERALNRLQGLVLSQSAADRIGAAPLVLRDYAPTETFLSAAETNSRGTSIRALSAAGAKPKPLSEGDHLSFGDGVTATVLYPPHGFRANRSEDRSLVLMIQLAAFRVLWCNDAGFTAQKQLLRTYADGGLKCDIIIRTRHKIDRTLLPDLLDTAKPRLVISTNNRFPNTEKLPPQLRLDCARRNIALLDQSETGAVTLRFWPDRLEITGFREHSASMILRSRPD